MSDYELLLLLLKEDKKKKNQVCSSFLSTKNGGWSRLIYIKLSSQVK